MDPNAVHNALEKLPNDLQIRFFRFIVRGSPSGDRYNCLHNIIKTPQLRRLYYELPAQDRQELVGDAKARVDSFIDAIRTTPEYQFAKHELRNGIPTWANAVTTEREVRCLYMLEWLLVPGALRNAHLELLGDIVQAYGDDLVRFESKLELEFGFMSFEHYQLPGVGRAIEFDMGHIWLKAVDSRQQDAAVTRHNINLLRCKNCSISMPTSLNHGDYHSNHRFGMSWPKKAGSIRDTIEKTMTEPGMYPHLAARYSGPTLRDHIQRHLAAYWNHWDSFWQTARWDFPNPYPGLVTPEGFPTGISLTTQKEMEEFEGKVAVERLVRATFCLKGWDLKPNHEAARDLLVPE